VGGKAAGLIEAWAHLPHGCRVPAGFVVTATAYRLHLLGESGERLRRVLQEADGPAAVSRRARAALLAAPVPTEVAEAVQHARQALGAVPLRPLGAERRHASLAGADTHPSPAAAGSSRDARAAGWDQTRRGRGLLVQRRAGAGSYPRPGEFPAILPPGASRRRQATSDRRMGELARARPGARRRDRETAPPELRLPCLDDAVLARLAALGRALEEAAGRALDLEFGVQEDGTIMLFQARRVARQA
jgi:phosphoenolpyruvate synthase/pyruvate phosphate dikinase